MSAEIEIVLEDERWASQLDPEKLVADVLRYAELNAAVSIPSDAAVTVLFCSDARIRELNSRWMHKDAPTNVLSFPAPISEGFGEGRYLGDIAISYETVSLEAQREGKSFDEHVAHMILHGLLHLLDFDHQNEEEAIRMEQIESEILVAMGMGDPWSGDNEKGFDND